MSEPESQPGRRHPPGLKLLFGVEMWERFSYYGMRAILVLFLMDGAAGGWGWSEERATNLYAWYTSLVYLVPIAGGYLADRFLGTHRSLIIGGSIIAAGHFCLAMQSGAMFFAGLALIVVGTGFFKANVSTMVGQLYRQGDPRRDAGFTIFYMGINLGAFLGPLVCGALRTRFGWHWGFGAAGVGMVLGLLTYLWGKRRYLGDIGDTPMARAASASGVPAATEKLTSEDRDRVVSIVVVSFFVIFFWLAYEQAGSSMNIFADKRTDCRLFGYEFPPEWFQSLNPAVILVCAPLFASLWVRLGARGREPSTATKMAVGLVLLGLGFVFMVFGARLSDGGLRVSPFWLTAAYVFHTWGELCLSPVGLSLVTKLAPAKLASALMGVWFLSNWVANFIAGKLAGLAAGFERGEAFTLLGGRADFFLLFVVSSIAAGLALFALTPRLRRLMHGRA